MNDWLAFIHSKEHHDKKAAAFHFKDNILRKALYILKINRIKQI